MRHVASGRRSLWREDRRERLLRLGQRRGQRGRADRVPGAGARGLCTRRPRKWRLGMPWAMGWEKLGWTPSFTQEKW